MCDPISIAVSYIVSEAAAEVVGAEILGSVFLADAVTGAIGGAAAAAIKGGDIGQGILGGAVGGGVGGAASSELGDVASYFGAPRELGTAAGRFAGSTAGGVATGMPLGQAAERGLISAGAGALSDIAFKDSGLDPTVQKLGSGALSSGISSLFAPSKSGVGATSYSPTARSSGQSASTQALSQALRTGDPGAPLFGTEGKEGQRKNVWNTASLKLKDETGT